MTPRFTTAAFTAFSNATRQFTAMPNGAGPIFSKAVRDESRAGGRAIAEIEHRGVRSANRRTPSVAITGEMIEETTKSREQPQLKTGTGRSVRY
jgi:hypothetical protein